MRRLTILMLALITGCLTTPEDGMIRSPDEVGDCRIKRELRIAVQVHDETLDGSLMLFCEYGYHWLSFLWDIAGKLDGGRNNAVANPCWAILYDTTNVVLSKKGGTRA